MSNTNNSHPTARQSSSLWSLLRGNAHPSYDSLSSHDTNHNNVTTVSGDVSPASLSPQPNSIEYLRLASKRTSDTVCSCSSDTESLTSHGSSHNLANSTPQQKSKSNTLSILQFATIIFYSVSGGPFGIEESIRAAGPFYTILGFLLAPLVFSFPECLMTVELSSAQGSWSSSAAGAAWAEEAFGPAAGFMTGYWNWVSGATDNAIYPVLFLEYALQIFPNENLAMPDDESASMMRFALITAISVGLAYLNWLGLELVGDMNMAVCVMSMSPFVLFVLLGAPQVDPQRWFRLPTDDAFVSMTNTTAAYLDAAAAASSDDDGMITMEGGFLPNIILGGVFLRPLMNNLFWNHNSFDNAASFAEDIQDPVRVWPRAMFLGFAMVVLGYVLPLLVALGTTDASPAEWVDGYLATVVPQTAGPWLGKWLVVAAALSNFGQFQAELSSDAYLLSGMASRGFLPKCLATRSPKTGTPTYALLVGTIVIVVMGVSNLDDLIEMLNFNYSLALLMEYAAFLKLRISRPDGT